jgi:hypothetical protein
MTTSLIIICFFTFLIHIAESLAYCMRLAGVRTRQIAIAMSFVTSTLLISRLSNMFQAPLMGAMVDQAILIGTKATLIQLEHYFRMVIFAAFIGATSGAFFAPTATYLFQKAVNRFLSGQSIPRIALSIFHPKNTLKIIKAVKLPRFRMLKNISLKNIPKGFLILNVLVTSIYTIGVLCALLAGAYLPHFRSTAINLSGIVNGLATIMLTVFVDPAGARITDQATHGIRSEDDVRSVVFFLQAGKILGTLVIAQLLLKPFTNYIIIVTKLIIN